MYLFYPFLLIASSWAWNVADPLFADQWHLSNHGQGLCAENVDIGVVHAWDLGFTGHGVTIAIVDNGIDVNHPEFSKNLNRSLSWNFVDWTPDPSHDPGSEHGTCVSALAAGGNDGLTCGVGVAFEATIAALRLLGGHLWLSSYIESLALSYHRDDIDIYSNSWGPVDDCSPVTVSATTRLAIEDSIRYGRGGKGNIYVWAAGNGFNKNDDVNYDGYASSRFAVAVSAISCDGTRASFSEEGASILVNAPGRDVVTASALSVCNRQFGGTSAAAPIVSGVIALMLEANPSLTWREVQHILVTTSTQNDPGSSSWARNGGGHAFSHAYGFGTVHAGRAVNAAIQMKSDPLGEEHLFATPFNYGGQIPLKEAHSMPVSVSAPGLIVESVAVEVHANCCLFGDIGLWLVGPDGFWSVLQRPNAYDGTSLDWTYASVGHWDGMADGLWSLKVWDAGTVHPESYHYSVVEAWRLVIYGRCMTSACAASVPLSNVTLPYPSFSRPPRNC